MRMLGEYNIQKKDMFLPTFAMLIHARDDLYYCSMLLTGVAASWKTIPGVLA